MWPTAIPLAEEGHHALERDRAKLATLTLVDDEEPGTYSRPALPAPDRKQ